MFFTPYVKVGYVMFWDVVTDSYDVVTGVAVYNERYREP